MKKEGKSKRKIGDHSCFPESEEYKRIKEVCKEEDIENYYHCPLAKAVYVTNCKREPIQNLAEKLGKGYSAIGVEVRQLDNNRIALIPSYSFHNNGEELDEIVWQLEYPEESNVTKDLCRLDSTRTTLMNALEGTEFGAFEGLLPQNVLDGAVMMNKNVDFYIDYGETRRYFGIKRIKHP